MRLAALVSGGKDSMFAVYHALKWKNEIACLITIEPESAESMLYHHPNTAHVQLQAESMHVPLIRAASTDSDEESPLRESLRKAINAYDIEGILHGGIFSDYQEGAFSWVAKDMDLDVMAPLWGTDEIDYMRSLVSTGFRAIITSVSAGGLDETWLGREITLGTVKELRRLAKGFGLNPSFEGGEAETFVLDCPLFEWPIAIRRSSTTWDGYRGTFEIQEAYLEKHAGLAKDGAARRDKKDRSS